MLIIEFEIERGWKAREIEAILPGHPRSWYLEKDGYPSFQFPSGGDWKTNKYPGNDICNAITAFIERHLTKRAPDVGQAGQ